MVDVYKKNAETAGFINPAYGDGVKVKKVTDYFGKPVITPTDPKTTANKNLLKGLGIDLDTVLTPKGKRKKRAGLVGGEPDELANELGG